VRIFKGGFHGTPIDLPLVGHTETCQLCWHSNRCLKAYIEHSNRHQCKSLLLDSLTIWQLTVLLEYISYFCVKHKIHIIVHTSHYNRLEHLNSYKQSSRHSGNAGRDENQEAAWVEARVKPLSEVERWQRGQHYIHPWNRVWM